MFESTYFTMLMKPTYEKPVDSPADIIERGLKVIYPPGTESSLEMSKNSPFDNIRRLAEMTVVPKVILFYIDKMLLTCTLYSRACSYF